MLDTGTTIAGYRIDGLVGEGCMGIVYRATQLSTGRPVALKFMASSLSVDAGFRERFRREALLQAQLAHPNVVPVYEAGASAEGMFIVMPLIEGPNLKDLIEQGSTQAPGRAVEILAPIAGALDAAHATGLVHRDVKPQNILIGPDGQPYLGDFGSSRSSDLPGLTRTGQMVGTIDYMSPEQMMGEPVSPRTDVYALAIVAYECLTGAVPFVKPTAAAVLYAHLMEPRPRVTALRPDLPAAVDDVIAVGMAQAPDARPGSASALIAALAEALGLSPPPESGRVSRAVGAPPASGPTDGRPPRDAGALARAATAGRAAAAGRAPVGD